MVGCGSSQGAAPLHIASAAGLVAPASLLLDAGAELNLATPDTEGNSPLHYAVGYGQPEVRVAFQLKSGFWGTNMNRRLSIVYKEFNNLTGYSGRYQ